MENLINTSKAIAFFSFFFGTILFILHFSITSDDILIAGFYYTVFAFLINSLVLLILIVSAAIDHKHRFQLLKTIGMVILNVPVTILYIYLIFN